ncbi:hypothetical protein OXYTRIMIC_666 [Oxytricha trifallax]|uniref:Uncharacterized protein n=1 Tax=Oxytricha trifallax TaxID=1172189 RepID=A0A073HZF3_9SPIT|nr:hypothetical protein OXYTRIMIC_666 [Oxytricha trifallax]
MPNKKKKQKKPTEKKQPKKKTYEIEAIKDVVISKLRSSGQAFPPRMMNGFPITILRAQQLYKWLMILLIQKNHNQRTLLSLMSCLKGGKEKINNQKKKRQTKQIIQIPIIFPQVSPSLKL